MKRILIVIPVYQYPTPECVESVINLISIYRETYDITIKLISGYAADVARTNAFNLFLQTDNDYLLFLDSDIIINEFAFDKLIKADKDIITGIYNKKTFLVQQSEVYKIVDNKFTPYNTNEIPQELFKIIACGFGCVLLKRNLVKQMMEVSKGVPFKFIQGNPYVSEDIYFCNLLSKHNIELWADGTAKVGHVGKNIF